MILQIKSFIYRFGRIFGLTIYLAGKEERAYIESLGDVGELSRRCSIGCWQGHNGFTSRWTHRLSFHRALLTKIKHAFTFRKYQ